MKIALSGGTGFIGKALVAHLRARGDDVIVWTRDPARAPAGVTAVRADLENPGPWQDVVDGLDGIVHLAGESIGDKRWTAREKQLIRDSRIETARHVVEAIERAERKPRVLVSASAVDYYAYAHPPLDDDEVTESDPPGETFLARVCRDWEREARAAEANARVVLLRTGLVLAAGGGALAQLALPFHFFAGGPMGSGQQVMSWIHRDDWLAMVSWLLADASVSGPVNLTAPHPVTNREMADAIGRALHRPSLLPAPAFALRLALGEMADAMILNGQRVLPRVAQERGFAFRFARVDDSLRAIYANRT